MRNNFYKELDKIMDLGYREFVDEIRANNKRSNERIFKLLKPDFVKDYKKFMKSVGHEFAFVSVVKEPVGSQFKDKRFKTIPDIWVQVDSNSSDTMHGTICVKITEDKWLKFQY